MLCRPRLKYHMDYCMEHPEELSRVAGLQKKVDEVKNVMVDNIEQVGGTSALWNACKINEQNLQESPCSELEPDSARHGRCRSLREESALRTWWTKQTTSARRQTASTGELICCHQLPQSHLSSCSSMNACCTSCLGAPEELALLGNR